MRAFLSRRRSLESWRRPASGSVSRNPQQHRRSKACEGDVGRCDRPEYRKQHSSSPVQHEYLTKKYSAGSTMAPRLALHLRDPTTSPPPKNWHDTNTGDSSSLLPARTKSKAESGFNIRWWTRIRGPI
jgi:hypothetical protein